MKKPRIIKGDPYETSPTKSADFGGLVLENTPPAIKMSYPALLFIIGVRGIKPLFKLRPPLDVIIIIMYAIIFVCGFSYNII